MDRASVGQRNEFSSHGLIKTKVRYINVKTYINLNLRSTKSFRERVPCSEKEDEKRNSSK